MTCSLCANAADPERDGEPPLAWSMAVTACGGSTEQVWTCPQCTRENARSIEAKLDQEWW